MKSEGRGYRQAARAEATTGNTERIMAAAFELFVERPFDQITLPAVAERAGVGLQTVIRRVGTKDGLVAAVNAWLAPRVAADGPGAPGNPDPVHVAAAFRRLYERWALAIERTLAQAESSPALAANAASGRAAQRAWLAATFADALAASPEPDLLRARLVAVTGVEVWLVLTRHEGLSADQAEQTLRLLITASLEGTPS
ncbi:MAG TPA: helix-turn-helix domain-containing protein [Actinoplanes sp.]|nr:helix-turn-helix domain-containing protein [Actinoplanes sp.]